MQIETAVRSSLADIERRRRAIDCPRAKLCRVAGVAAQTYSAVMRGKRPPSLQTISRLEKAIERLEEIERALDRAIGAAA